MHRSLHVYLTTLSYHCREGGYHCMQQIVSVDIKKQLSVLFFSIFEFIMAALLPVIILSSATLMGHCFPLRVTYTLHLKLTVTTNPIIGHC